MQFTPWRQTQVKFVWGICTYRDETHDSTEVDECLNNLEASGNDGSDGEFGFKLKRNGRNEDEIRTQITDMCSDVYADVVRQGIVLPGDGTAPTADPSPVASPTESSPVSSPIASPTLATQPTASANGGGSGLTLAPFSYPSADSPVMAPTVASADDLDNPSNDGSTTTNTETAEYFDVFFTYRMDFSDESMTAEIVASDHDAAITSTIANILQEQGVSRRLSVSLSSAVADPIENINYADAVCPEEEAGSSEAEDVVKSCILVVSLVRVEAEKDVEDQSSADSAIQTPLRISMAPISDEFEETVDIDGLVQVEWISSGPGQDAIVNLGTDGTGGNKSLSNGGIAALAVCLTVLLAGGLFALARRREDEDDDSIERDIDEVEAQEIRSASISKDLSSSKPIATGFLPKDGDASIDHNIEIESVAASSVPQESGGMTAEGSGDWAACGATAAILASSKPNLGDDVSSLAPSSRVPTPTPEEDRAGSAFAEILFDLPPESLGASHPSHADLTSTSLVAPEKVPQLSPQGEALNCSRSLGGSSSAVSEVTSAPGTQARTSDSLPGLLKSTNSSTAKSGPTIGYTGIAMAGAAAAGTAVAVSNRNGDEQSFDGSFISEKPSEADIPDRSVTGKSTIVSPQQQNALNRIDAALTSGDWAVILSEANAITANDDNQSLISEMSSLRANFVATSRNFDRTNLSLEDAKKAAYIDSLIAHGDWNKVGEAASQYEEEASTKKSLEGGDEASQKTARSSQSFLSRLFDRKPGTPEKASGNTSKNAHDNIALVPTYSSEDSPEASRPPTSNDSSPDSQSAADATNPYLSNQQGQIGGGVAALTLSSLLDPDVSVSDNNSQVSADRPLLASSQDKKRKKSPKNLFGLAGSKNSSPSNAQPSEYDDDATPKASWKQKLGLGGKSKSASEAIDHLAMLEDASVESRSLGSDAMNGQEEMRSSAPSDIPSSISGASPSSRSETPVNGGSFAAAALFPAGNTITGSALNDVSNDMYASSASASIPPDIDNDDSISNRSFVDDLDVAIETGNWTAVEKAAANMLNGASSLEASSHPDGGVTSDASSDFHSVGSHLSSYRDGSSIGASSVNTDKIKALEQAVENNNWQRVLELSGKYKKEASEDGESPKGAAAAAAWAIDRSFNAQIGEDKEGVGSGDDEV
jgi:hypothetical protein